MLLRGQNNLGRLLRPASMALCLDVVVEGTSSGDGGERGGSLSVGTWARAWCCVGLWGQPPPHDLAGELFALALDALTTSSAKRGQATTLKLCWCGVCRLLGSDGASTTLDCESAIVVARHKHGADAMLLFHGTLGVLDVDVAVAGAGGKVAVVVEASNAAHNAAGVVGKGGTVAGAYPAVSVVVHGLSLGLANKKPPWQEHGGLLKLAAWRGRY